MNIRYFTISDTNIMLLSTDYFQTSTSVEAERLKSHAVSLRSMTHKALRVGPSMPRRMRTHTLMREH